MITRGHRRTAPALFGLATAALVAVLVVVMTMLGRPAAPAGSPESSSADLAGGPALDAPDTVFGSGSTAAPLLLPVSPPLHPAPAPGTGSGPDAALPIPAPPSPSPATPAPGPPNATAGAPRLAAPPRPRPPVIPRPRLTAPVMGGPAAQVVALTNAERAKAGCPPLRVDRRLVLSAQRHSQDMADRGYFDHESPEGTRFSDRERAAGFRGKGGGENIARGQRTAAEVMADWMSSPGHRRNILDCDFTVIGVGYVADGRYWTQNFGR